MQVSETAVTLLLVHALLQLLSYVLSCFLPGAGLLGWGPSIWSHMVTAAAGAAAFLVAAPFGFRRSAWSHVGGLKPLFTSLSHSQSLLPTNFELFFTIKSFPAVPSRLFQFQTFFLSEAF